MNIKVREACDKDIVQIVEVHINAFEGYYTTSLGRKFLYQFYRLFLDKKKCCLMVALDQEKVIGFIAGINSGYTIATLFKQKVHLFIVPLLLQSLNIQLGLQIIKRGLLVLKFGRVNEIPIKLNEYHEIMSFAVLSNWQGRGVGKNIYKKFENFLLENNRSKGICLTTDLCNNEEVLIFYSKQGYKKVCSYQQSKMRRMCLLRKKID